MYPGTGTGFDSIINGLMVGGLVYIGIVLAIWAFGMLVAYLLIKAAVRDGIIEAARKTGSAGLGGTTYVQGWPPPQDYGAPPAPTHTGGYGS